MKVNVRKLIKEEVQKLLKESTDYFVEPKKIKWTKLLKDLKDGKIADIEIEPKSKLDASARRGYLTDTICVKRDGDYMWIYKANGKDYVDNFSRYGRNDVDEMIEDITNYYDAAYIDEYDVEYDEESDEMIFPWV